MIDDEKTEKQMQQIGKTVEAQIPDGWGFVVMVFPFRGASGNVNYVSSADPRDVTAMVEAWLPEFKKKIPTPAVTEDRTFKHLEMWPIKPHSSDTVIDFLSLHESADRAYIRDISLASIRFENPGDEDCFKAWLTDVFASDSQTDVVSKFSGMHPGYSIHQSCGRLVLYKGSHPVRIGGLDIVTDEELRSLGDLVWDFDQACNEVVAANIRDARSYALVAARPSPSTDPKPQCSSEIENLRAQLAEWQKESRTQLADLKAQISELRKSAL